jgi:hypothetical protein
MGRQHRFAPSPQRRVRRAVGQTPNGDALGLASDRAPVIRTWDRVGSPRAARASSAARIWDGRKAADSSRQSRSASRSAVAARLGASCSIASSWPIASGRSRNDAAKAAKNPLNPA